VKRKRSKCKTSGNGKDGRNPLAISSDCQFVLLAAPVRGLKNSHLKQRKFQRVSPALSELAGAEPFMESAQINFCMA
jgi:hypothetical protein